MSLKDAREAYSNLSHDDSRDNYIQQFKQSQKVLSQRGSRLVKAGVADYSEVYHNYSKDLETLGKGNKESLLTDKGNISAKGFNELLDKAFNPDGTVKSKQAKAKLDKYFQATSEFVKERNPATDQGTIKGTKKHIEYVKERYGKEYGESALDVTWRVYQRLKDAGYIVHGKTTDPTELDSGQAVNFINKIIDKSKFRRRKNETQEEFENRLVENIYERAEKILQNEVLNDFMQAEKIVWGYL